MNSLKKIPFNTVLSALDSPDDTRNSALEQLGVSAVIIQFIRKILYKYSYIDHAFLFNAIAALVKTHAPEQGLLRFERFLDIPGKHVSADVFPRHAYSLLAAVWSTSGALSNRLNADKGFVEQMCKLIDPELPRMDRAFYVDELMKYPDGAVTITDKVRAVHLHHTVQLMRICARNTDNQVVIDEINAELSCLAEAVIEVCFRIACEEVFSTVSPLEQPDFFFVLGLGKLGGRELNVSSDIDLIYLCDRREGWHSFEDMGLHTSLAERLTTLLSEPTGLGYLYRVDTRLRADGLSGPLVRTTEDYFRYLEMRGEAWERQMLLKARPVAGNIEAGQVFLDSLARFIFPTGITRSPNREIVSLKNQIEARISSEGSKNTHLKLMPGGIRDIEFIVQCLQLLMGGKHPEVRVPGTIHGLDRLKKTGGLNDREHSMLSTAYRLYRRIENALQWRELLPAFTLPDTPETMGELAEFLDCRDISEELNRSVSEVRGVYNDIFSLHDGESFEDLAVRSAVNPTGDEKVRRFLENMGFADPEKSARDLSMLVFGKLSGTTELNLHPSIERFVPVLLRRLGDLPDPGGTLERFIRIADAYNVRTALFDILEHNHRFLDLLLSITHGSVFLTDILVKDPSLLDWLVEAGQILRPIDTRKLLRELFDYDADMPDDRMFTRECLKVKLREKLRLGTRDITGLSTSAETLAGLTRVAESILQAVYKRASRNISAHHPSFKSQGSFCIIGAGKLGASTMDFGSDLDLIFVYGCSGSQSHDYEFAEGAISFAQYILSLITGSGGADKIYDVDARLRPEGGNAPLAISAEEYRRYCERRASVWERLALVRARFLAGDTRLGSDVMETIHSFVYRGQFKLSEIREVLAMRETIERTSAELHGGMRTIKSGPGGIMDIEFITQTYAAHYGHTHPRLCVQDTSGILEALAAEHILTKPDTETLADTYDFLRGVEKAIRIGSGKAVNTLPESGIELARVARLLDFKNVRKFSRRLSDITELSRELYNRLMGALTDDATAGTE